MNVSLLVFTTVENDEGHRQRWRNKAVTKCHQMGLKQAREEHGWSQKDVAELIGTDPKTVSRWERGVAYPAPYFRQKLADLFKKSLRELELFAPAEREREDDDSNVSPARLPAEMTADARKPPNGGVDGGDRQSDRQLAAKALSTQRARIAALYLENRRRMLRRLRHTYGELLENSLHQISWIELGLASISNAVQNAANRLVRLPEQNARVLPAGASILEVYETAERELLILGEPGAGKSSLLLHLALALVDRAEQEDAHPLPVVLYLSSWAEHHTSLETWMSDQLALTYDVSSSLSTQWVRDDQVLPLLDGLDEMDTASRAGCIAAINAYHRKHLLVPLVICSRRAEYDDAARCQKLALQSAVLIQPLTFEQVCAALNHIGNPPGALRQVLKTNPALRELITTPLMLTILKLTYARAPAPTLSREISTLQRQVLTDYVERMTELKGDARRYSHQETCSWLSWMACNLKRHYQTVFYLEHVQSDWLPDSLRKPAFQLAMCLPLILLGMLCSFVIGLLLQTVFDLTTGIQAMVIGGLLGGCLSQLAGAGKDGGPFRMAGKRPRTGGVGRGLISVGVGLLVGLSFGFELGPGYGTGDWARDGWVYGSSLALVSWMLLALLPHVSSRRKSSRAPESPAYLRHWLSRLHLWRTLLAGTGLGLGYGLSTGLSYGLDYGPSAGLNVGLSYSCVAFLISFIVEKYQGDIRLTEQLRWTWSGFFRALCSAKHCFSSGVLALGVLLVVGLSYGLTVGLGSQVSPGLGFRLSYGLSYGLSAGLSSDPGAALADGLVMGVIVGAGTGLGYWLVLGLFQSVAQEQLDDEDRQRLNQGVLGSARNSAVIGVLSGAIIGGIGFLGYWLSYGLNAGLSDGLSYGLDVGPSRGLGYALSAVWLFAVGGGMVGWAVSGGCAVLQHVILRWLLHRRHVFPWQTQGFLDDATTRILLRRVGGGYSFIHRLLLEYFASLEDGTASGRAKHYAGLTHSWGKLPVSRD